MMFLGRALGDILVRRLGRQRVIIYGAALVFVGVALAIYWGSIDAANPPANRYDNVLTVNGSLGGSGAITGSDLLGLGWTDGLGNQFSAADNQWFNVKLASGETISSFMATSSNNAFEFDMAVPEPSTWAMMGLGFAALGYAASRRTRKTPAIA